MGGYYWIVLGDDDGTFRKNSEGPPRQFIEEVRECIILLLFSFYLLRGELQFTLQFASKEKIN